MEMLSEALERSPADETAISWLEVERQEVGERWRHLERSAAPRRRRNVQVRVLEGGRLGSYRTQASTWGGMEQAIRQAMAHARANEKVPGFPHLAGDRSKLPDLPELRDAAIRRMDQVQAAEDLSRRLRDDERGRLRWGEVRLAVVSSRGMTRYATATEIGLEVASGPSEVAGYAARTTRSLATLPWNKVLDRARTRRGTETFGEWPSASSFPVVLAPEATAQLLDVVNRRSLTAWDYELGDTFLREFLGVQVFDRSLELVDDATDPDGLPFPFDLEGTAKRRIPIIEHGVPRTPALDQFHAARWGLPPTPHACAGDDARFEHLALAAGDARMDDLLAAADGGVWIGRLERLECFEPRRLRIRALARGCRRIEGGRRTASVPDVTWETNLLQALGHVAAVGHERTLLTDPSGEFGGIRAPSLALTEAAGFRIPSAGGPPSDRHPAACRG